MKKLLFVIAISVFLNACGGGDSKPTYRLIQITSEDLRSSTIDRTLYTYNDSGFMIGYSTDFQNDGVIDSKTSYFYDSNNRVIKYERDTDNNGTADTRSTYNYGTDGRIESREYDSNLLDTEIDQTSYYFYNANNQVERIEVKDRFNNPIGTSNYAYNESGYVIRLESNGRVSTRSLVFDENGRLHQRRFDFENDGVDDYAQTFTYEPGPCIIAEPVSLRKTQCQ